MSFNPTIFRSHFHADALLTAVQTAATVAATKAVIYLGRYVVIPQTAVTQSTVLITTVAGLFSSLIENITQSKLLSYLSIPVGMGVGIGAHRFFYPAIPTNALLSVKGLLLIGVALASVKAAVDHLFPKNWIVIDEVTYKKGKFKETITEVGV